MMLVYTLSVVLSAFLLFLVQPMISKIILPWFGGSSTVWTTSVMFFQVVLLAGYAYSHRLSHAMTTRKALRVHRVLLVVSVCALALNGIIWNTPLTPGAFLKPAQAGQPVAHILLILILCVGLPYFMLSTNGPFVQTWYRKHFQKQEPYWLYAASNAGSLVALLAYPFVMEPLLDMNWQPWLWTAGYALYALLTFAMLRQEDKSGDMPNTQDEKRKGIPVRFERLYPLWFGLSFATNVLLLSATNRMTQDIAPIPFLWVVPLAVYLLTFILTYSNEKGYSRWMIAVFFVAVNMLVLTMVRGNALPIVLQLNIYVLAIFSGCMVAHGELVRLRPPAEHLTVFYLVQALGGAAGGIFVSIFAPMIFNGYWELPLSVLLILILLVISLFVDKESPLYHKWLVYPTTLLLLGTGFVMLMNLVPFARSYNYQTVWADRNFYGITRVKATESESGLKVYQMVHGTTLHGIQYANVDLRNQPTAYFTPGSGIARGLMAMMDTHDDMQVGVLGLGVGTLVSYARPDDTYRLYEINPAVTDLAYDTRYFHYLTDSPADVTVIEGDGRLALERELASGDIGVYDVLILDAFSGDSVPVHLMTQEAVNVYLALLAEDGLLAFNVSNTHLDFQPVLAQVSEYFDLVAVYIEDAGTGELASLSRWVLLTRNGAFFQSERFAGVAQPLDPGDKPLRMWTDDYSNLFQILIVQ